MEQNIYKNKDTQKAKWNHDVNQGIINNDLWFKNKNINNKDIKILNRLRTGHVFDKKFQKLMNIIDNDTCDECKIKEDFIHMFEKCKKYNDITKKYSNIEKKGILELLKENNMTNYEEILKYIKEAKINL